jgi:hypothetical protein
MESINHKRLKQTAKQCFEDMGAKVELEDEGETGKLPDLVDGIAYFEGVQKKVAIEVGNVAPEKLFALLESYDAVAHFPFATPPYSYVLGTKAKDSLKEYNLIILKLASFLVDMMNRTRVTRFYLGMMWNALNSIPGDPMRAESVFEYMMKAGKDLGVDMTESVKSIRGEVGKMPPPFIEYGEGEPPKEKRSP